MILLNKFLCNTTVSTDDCSFTLGLALSFLWKRSLTTKYQCWVTRQKEAKRNNPKRKHTFSFAQLYIFFFLSNHMSCVPQHCQPVLVGGTQDI